MRLITLCRLALSIAVLTLVAACGAPSTSTTPTTTATLQSLAILPGTPNALPVGLTQQFGVSGTYSDGTSKVLSSGLTWSSSSASVATVDNTGLATAVAPGASTLTVTETASAKTSTVALTVNAATLQTLTVAPASPAALPVGLTQQFAATGHYNNGQNLALTSGVTWDTDLHTQATVDSAGLLTALAAGGPVTVTASVGVQSGTAQITVSTAVLTSITISANFTLVPLGIPALLTPTGHFSDGSPHLLTTGITWASDNAAATVTNVNGVGVVTPAAAGVANITVTDTGTSLSKTVAITVTGATLSSIAVTPGAASQPGGLTQQFTATGTYSDSSPFDITLLATWSSGNPLVATVDSGTLTAGLAHAVDPACGLIHDSIRWRSPQTPCLPQPSTSVTISASFQTVSSDTTTQSATFTVTTALLQTITLAAQYASLPKAPGLTSQLTATGHFSDSAARNVSCQMTWSTSVPDSSILTVDPCGVVTPLLAGGPVTVTADNGAGITSTIQVTVTSATVTSVTVAPPTPSVPLGLTQQFNATANFSDGFTFDVTLLALWSNGGCTETAYVDQTGLASTSSPGPCTISALYPNPGVVTGTAQLTVTAAVLQTITVTAVISSTSTFSIPAGTRTPFTAMGQYTGGPDVDITSQVTWSISDVNNFTNNGGGLFTNIQAPTPGTAPCGTVVAANPTATSATISASMGAISSTTSGGDATLFINDASVCEVLVATQNTNVLNNGGVYVWNISLEPGPVQWQAIGTFTDGSSFNLTDAATWSTLNNIKNAPSTQVSVDAAGLATASGVNTSNYIEATFGGLSSTELNSLGLRTEALVVPNAG